MLNESKNNDVMLKAAALAERWSTSTGRLANMRCAGTGPAFMKIGESVRYRLCDVEDYERANTVAPIA
ncbi:hypothetical protein [Nocardioides sp.]|uniref:hypothetical protein n=1 Tax=Nocardioides sp. TaxID=35761 RepID=UPI0025FF928F|nr:hypothetical protein [Nocardioides sp.]